MISLFMFVRSVDVNFYEFNCRFVKQQISRTVQNASFLTLLERKNDVEKIACRPPIQAHVNI